MTKTGRNKVRSNIFLDPDLKERMRLVAKKNHRSLGEEINYAMDLYLQGQLDSKVERVVEQLASEEKVKQEEVEVVDELPTTDDVEDF